MNSIDPKSLGFTPQSLTKLVHDVLSFPREAAPLKPRTLLEQVQALKALDARVEEATLTFRLADTANRCPELHELMSRLTSAPR